MQKVIDRMNIQSLEEAILEVIWIQWRSLGAFINSDRMAYSMVDPEALLLISLTLTHNERRLWDILASWAKNGSKLFSLQRVNNLLGLYPGLTKDRLAEFAYLARKEGNDFRWRSLTGADASPDARKQDLWKAYPSAWHPTALMLRLRLGLGMGVLPDLLCFLLCLHGEWASASQIAQAIQYTPYSIRRVAHDMAAAQILESTQVKPVRYRVKPEAWSTILLIDCEIPMWRYWNQMYSFAAELITRHESGEWENLSPYIVSSQLRDLVEDHRDGFIWNQIELPAPRKYPGEEYLPAFAKTIDNLVYWIKNKA